jgi:hypothetical protein
MASEPSYFASATAQGTASVLRVTFYAGRPTPCGERLHASGRRQATLRFPRPRRFTSESFACASSPSS